MSIECGECERDLRGGHASSCSRYVDKRLDTLPLRDDSTGDLLACIEDHGDVARLFHFDGVIVLERADVATLMNWCSRWLAKDDEDA